MRHRLILALTAVAAVGTVSLASAQASPQASPPTVPFPAAQVGDVFVSAQTVTADGAISNYFAPGANVVFRAYALDGKTKKFVTGKTAKFFYVKIPSQPNLKLKWTPGAPTATGRYAWTGTWTVPADYPKGVVGFKVLVKTKSKRVGSFVQIPVASSQLTITATPQAPPGGGPAAKPSTGGATATLGIYADTVNGSRPAGAAPRPIGCTQTNVFKRGEQLVLRTWGFDLGTGAVLTMENVTDAHFSVPGQPNVALNWGSHGPAGAKVWFWTNFWNIPKDYPLGDATLRVSFTTDAGKAGTLDYPITVIP